MGAALTKSAFWRPRPGAFLTKWPAVPESLIKIVVRVLAVPKQVNLRDQALSMSIISGFSQTRFTKAGDEVIGALSVLGILCGKGPVPIGTRVNNLPSPEEVQYALELLGQCWATQLDAGGGMLCKLNNFRVTPLLQTLGLGVLRFTRPINVKDGDGGEHQMSVVDRDGFVQLKPAKNASYFTISLKLTAGPCKGKKDIYCQVWLSGDGAVKQVRTIAAYKNAWWG